MFRGVLEADPQLLAALRDCQDDIWLDTNGLRFSLPALHAYLYNPAQLDYARFRQALYAGELNTLLHPLGGQVVIHSQAGKVDQTIYRLTWHAP